MPLADLAASFEAVVADVLVERSLRCARDHGLQRLVMVGGVAANRRLRLRMQQRPRLLVSIARWPTAPKRRHDRSRCAGASVQATAVQFSGDRGFSPLATAAR